MSSLADRARRAWDVFRGRDPTDYKMNYGPGYSRRPDKTYIAFGGERSIVNGFTTESPLTLRKLT